MSDDQLLHCSLLIPSFQIDHNRPVMFWHLHQDNTVGGSAWGYSTVNRLRPYAGIPRATVDDKSIIKAVAEAMAGSGQVDGKQSKPFPAKTAEDVLAAERAGPNVINITMLQTWDAGYLKILAGAVYQDLPQLVGFKQDDIAKVIECALLLLEYGRCTTFGQALSAAIIPQLRPDMLTSMYVVAEPAPVTTPAVQGGESPSWLQRARAQLQNAAAAVQDGAAALQALVLGAAATQLAVPLPEACRFFEAQCGDSLHVYNVDFNLCDVVHASTAAPTFFSGVWDDVTKLLVFTRHTKHRTGSAQLKFTSVTGSKPLLQVTNLKPRVRSKGQSQQAVHQLCTSWLTCRLSSPMLLSTAAAITAVINQLLMLTLL
jgi:hypothetical protein